MTENATIAGAISTVEEFLAHALTLENEAANTYQEIGDSLAVHNNAEAAALFFKFAGYGRKHADEVRGLAEGLTLPRIPPWEFVWGDGDSPEAATFEDAHYMMTPAHALDLALRAEHQAHDFYAAVAAATADAKISEMAAEFAAEEAEHVRMLEDWIAKVPAAEATWAFDPDPPSMPE